MDNGTVRTGGKLAAKMAKAMGEIGRVPKRGRNQAQGYNYARADDVAEHTREVLSKLGVAVYANVVESGLREFDGKNGKMRISTVNVAWTFVDAESGEERTVTVPGEGFDTGDKGIYKAMTGSLKYALMLGFLIPTGDGDPERDEESERPAFTSTPRGAEKQVTAQIDLAKRKRDALAWCDKALGDVETRKRLAHILGRTFPAGTDIKFQSEEELAKVEAWVELAKASASKEARGE